MERIEKLFPRFDSNGKELILKAYRIAENALKDHRRSNGQPFIEHPIATAVIAYEEIGLPAECIAAIFLHEATRFFLFDKCFYSGGKPVLIYYEKWASDLP